MLTIFELLASVIIKTSWLSGIASNNAIKLSLGLLLAFGAYVIGLRLFMYIKKHSSVLVPVLLLTNALTIYFLLERI